MKVLVLGGSGIIGTGIVNASIVRGYEVYALTRGIKEKQNNSNIHYIKCDWSNLDEARMVLKDQSFDVIVDGRVFTELQLIRDLELVKGHCKQYIYVSTSGVYEQPATNFNEDSPKRLEKLLWGYSYNKRKAEIYIEKNRKNFDFMITTVRPPFTYGDTRIPVAMVGRANQYTLLDRIINDKPIVFIDDGSKKHAITHISTFSDGVVALFMHPKSDGEMYHITDDEVYTWEEVIETVGKIINKKPNIVHVPIEKLKKLHNDLYQEIKYNKMAELILDNSKIKSIAPEVNYKVSLEEGLSQTVKHLQVVYSNQKLDENFNKVCDLLLLDSVSNLSDNEKDIAKDYLKTLTPNYKKQLKRFRTNQLLRYYTPNIVKVCISKILKLVKK